MKHFLAIYMATPSSLAKWREQPESVRAEKQAAGAAAWQAWVEQHKASIVDMGAPLGKTKAISRAGISEIRNAMTAYTVVQAETHEAAARLFENHPHFTMFPGELVEVMECLPLPG